MSIGDLRNTVYVDLVEYVKRPDSIGEFMLWTTYAVELTDLIGDRQAVINQWDLFNKYGCHNPCLVVFARKKGGPVKSKDGLRFRAHGLWKEVCVSKTWEEEGFVMDSKYGLNDIQISFVVYPSEIPEIPEMPNA